MKLIVLASLVLLHAPLAAQPVVPASRPIDSALFTTVVSHVKDSHLPERTFVIATSQAVDASHLTQAAESLGAARLVEARAGSGVECNETRRRCNVDGADSVLRILAFQERDGTTFVRIYVGHTINGPDGSTVRGGSRLLTIESVEGELRVVADDVLFRT
jgi:hypothetical protein